MNRCEIAVIGGGLAGLSAARHALRLGHAVTMFDGSGLFGGQVATVNSLKGLPMPGAHSGQELAMSLLEQAKRHLFKVVEDHVAAIGTGERLSLTDATGHEYRPEAIIIASGASLRPLGVAGEEAFIGRGVSHCASCDGGFFRRKDVAVVGGGDAAVTEAMVLAETSGRVIMICRSPLRAQSEYVDQLTSRENIEFVWDSEVDEILGDQSGMTGLRLRNVKTKAMTVRDCHGVFPFIGVTPNTHFLPPSMLDADGKVTTGDDLATTDRRIFAAGAVRAGCGGHVVEAMAEGISAARSAGVARSRAKA